MKKLLFIAMTLALACVSSASAQSDYDFWKHKSPIRLGYTLGVGVEMRQGKGKYKDMTSKIAEELMPDDLPGGIDEYMPESDEKIKLKTKAIRVYLSIRF